MTWTRTPPTAPGWYWVWGSRGEAALARVVPLLGGRLYILRGAYSTLDEYAKKHPRTLWAGPLIPPPWTPPAPEARP